MYLLEAFLTALQGMDLSRFGISPVSPETPNHSFRGRFGGFAAVDDVISDELVVCSLFTSFD